MSQALLRVEHVTEYRYGAPVVLAHHMAVLQPIEDAFQQLEAFELQVDPLPSHHGGRKDTWGNHQDLFSLTVPHEELVVSAQSRVRLTERHRGFDPAVSIAWDALVEALRYRPPPDCQFDPTVEFVYTSPFVPLLPELRAYAQASFPVGRPIGAAAVELMQRIYTDFEYSTDSTEISTPLATAFKERHGVCQDFSHVMIGAFRALGLPARYVSGYLLTRPPPGKERLVGADASHAWVQVRCPQAAGGWLDLDPTNNCIPGLSHVHLAVGRDYGDVAPVRGVIRGGGKHVLDVRVSTQPAWEMPGGFGD
jgi:transglutaminase-like putative cysteine protease